jgi:hypothetical protein
MGSAANAGYAILLIIFIIGVIIAIAGFIWENTIPLAHPDKLDAMNTKFAGVIMIVIAAGIGLGVNSGTGRPHGGRRYKGMGGY